MSAISRPLSTSREASGVLIRSTSDIGSGGLLLAFPGNAQTARELAFHLASLADDGFDVYSFDYPNLLGTQPLPRLHDLVNDARALVTFYLKDPRYKDKVKVLYGVSTGGVILAQAVRGNFSSSVKLVLDSVPDRLPWLLMCDAELDPSRAVEAMTPPTNALLIINGAADSKVLPANSRALAKAAERLGGCHAVLPRGTHPYEEGDDVFGRLELIRRLSRGGQPCRAK